MNKALIKHLGDAENDSFRHLYFEKDMENGGRGEVFLFHYFKWDRERSNENIDKYGFSFYLALNIYNGYTVLFIDHSLRLDSGYIAYRQHGYLFQSRYAGVVELFLDLENPDYLDCIRICEAREVSGEFCDKYIAGDIRLLTDLFGLRNWGANWEKIEEYGWEKYLKLTYWYRDYPGTELFYIGYFWLNDSLSELVNWHGITSFTKEDIASGKTVLPNVSGKYPKDHYMRMPSGSISLVEGKIVISFGSDCSVDIILKVLDAFRLKEFDLENLVIENDFFEEQGGDNDRI